MAALDWVGSTITADGGVPFMLHASEGWPAAPWMQPADEGCHLTFGYVAQAAKHGLTPAWLGRAQAWCDDRLDEPEGLGGYNLKYALKLLDVAGRPDIPVHAGCDTPLVHAADDAAYVHGLDGFGDTGYTPSARAAHAEHAALALIRYSHEYANDITYVMLGPLTNLALALKLDPTLPQRVPRLVIMGGAGSLEVAPGQRLVDQPGFPDVYRSEALAHAALLGRLREVRDVRWAYASPAAEIAPGERTGEFRLGGDTLLSDESGRSFISAEDFAIALVDEAESGAHLGTRFTAGY